MVLMLIENDTAMPMPTITLILIPSTGNNMDSETNITPFCAAVPPLGGGCRTNSAASKER